jgi:hypothetical protein
MFSKNASMLFIKESKTKDIDKEVRLLRKYREATIQLPCAVNALIRAGATHIFSIRVRT